MYNSYLMYLRKSRQDDPRETVEEVLAKHETILQDYALRTFGYKIPEEHIYREVVSGESIEDRVEVKKLLRMIESSDVVGVLVVEPQRLSRGDLLDCGQLINKLRYSNTLVVTPMMTYNLENKMDRRFFQDELMRGRDYLEYTKEILMRGREAAAMRGCYIANKPPYGYDKVIIGKDKTLVPNENAEIVRLIFDLYVKENMNYREIARKLNAMGSKPMMLDAWNRHGVRCVLNNIHYIGKIAYRKRKHVTTMENGELVTRRPFQPKENVLIAEGKHPAIVDVEIFEAAQRRIDNNPRLWDSKELTNVFAGILICGKCGKVMVQHPYHHAGCRIECRTKPMCYKSAKMEDVVSMLITALEQAELPKLKTRLKNGDGNALEIQRKLITILEKQMSEYRDQEEKQYELLETGRYTPLLFDRRNKALREKMKECEERLTEAKKNLPEEVNFKEKVISLEQAIAALKDDSVSITAKNKFLKAIVDKVVYTSGERGDRNHKGFNLKVYLKL